ncbi:Plant protein of unknown function D, partial [Prunus dulcis]
KNAELDRGAPRLVINYKPLNIVLEWIRYPIPNKRDLINILGNAIWILANSDRYKTAFVTPFGHYECNIRPFGLKNAPNEFQNIINEIFNPFSHFSIVYIDDVLIFSQSLEQHWKYLHKFLQIVKQNGLGKRMVEKRTDKQKEKQKESQSFRALPASMNPVKTESSSKIVPFLGCSRIQISNRFTPLGPQSAKFVLVSNYVHNDFPPVIIPAKPAQKLAKPPVIIHAKPSLSTEGKSKVELQEIARQLILQASQMEDEEDSASPRSQSSTSQPHQLPGQKDSTQKMQWADYQDSQDPYDLNSD